MHMSTKRDISKLGIAPLIIVVIIAVILVVGGAAYYLSTMQTPPGNNTHVTPLPNMTLTVVGLNGTTVTLNSAQIGNLTAFTSLGAWVTSAGHINTVVNYTDVKITTLCNLVGGLTNSTALKATASDGYSMVFTYDQVMGAFTTYDPVTGNEVQHNQPLTTILAYFENGTGLQTGSGPLRFAIVGPEGLITDGHFWIKDVTRLDVEAAVAEYTLTLNGTKSGIYEVMGRATLESGVNCHGENWTDSSTGIIWTGIPLWYLVGHIDDSNIHEDNAFNRTLADLGYTVRIIANDGYYIDLDSTLVKLNNNILLANMENGSALETKYWPLRLVGSGITKSQMIRNVVEIDLLFPDYTLTLNGTTIKTVYSFNLDDLVSQYPASWVDTNTTTTWTGIPLWRLVGMVDDSNSTTFNDTLADSGYTVKIIANDGFATNLNSTFVKLNDDIILANLENGTALESKYWPLRLVGSALTKGQMARNVVAIEIVFGG